MNGDYRPGGLLAVVDRHGVALLPGTTGDETLAAVRQALGAGPADAEPAAAVLEALTFGTRMSDLAPFAAAVVADGGLHLLVRGDFDLVVEGPEPVRVSGAHVTSWREQWVPGAASVQIEAGAGAPAGGRRLPIERGVVLAGAVRLAIGPEPEAPVSSGAAVLLEPVPVEPVPVEPVPVEPEPVEPEPVGPGPVAAAGPLPADLLPVAPDPTAEARGQTTLYGDVTLGEPPTLVTGVPGAGSEADDEGATDFAYMWHTGIDQGVERAAMRQPEAEPAAAVPAPQRAADERAGDHDGETVMLEDILGGPARPPVPSGAGVLSRFCPANHQNPPHAVVCATCGSALTGEPRLGPRPTLGRLRLATGETVELDRTVVLGRRPQATRVSAGDVPRLVSVGGKEISRSHLELRVDDWSVVATDLGSRNGTMLLRPGQPPVRLVEPTPVRAGDRFDLGEGIVLGAEDVP